MNFKPKRIKIIISIVTPLLIIIVLLTLILKSDPFCHYGGNCEKGDICIDYYGHCSIFEFTYTVLYTLILLFAILSLSIYVFYSLVQRK